MIFRRALLLMIVLLVLMGLSACTRARTPWPEDIPFELPSVVPATSTAIATPTLSGTLLPRYTPHVTPPPTPTVPTPSPTAPGRTTRVTPAPKATLAPTQPIPTQVVPTIPPGGALYIVQPGDTLFDIAEKFNVPLQKLADVNHITDPTSIYPMQRLIIP